MPMFGAAHTGRFLSAKQHKNTMRDLKVREERLGDWQKEKEARIKKLISQGYRVSEKVKLNLPTSSIKSIHLS